MRPAQLGAPEGPGDSFAHKAGQPGIDAPAAYPDLVRGEVRGYIDNNEGEAVRTTVRLRAAQGIPELWDLVSGHIIQSPCYYGDEDGVSVRLELDRYESVFVVCRFDWPQGSVLSAGLVIEGMTQVIEAKLNGKDLGLRFAYPYRFELGGALRPGSNELELRLVERYTFKPRRGNIKIVPYCEFRI